MAQVYLKNKTVVEQVWIGHDNIIKLKLSDDGVSADLSGSTRMTLEFGSVLLDSAVHTGAFDWSAGEGVLVLQLGAHVTDEFNGFARLVIYTAANPNGLVWIDGASWPRLELRIINE